MTEKYKSSFIKDEDISVSVNKRYEGNTRIEIVEIKYLPSGFFKASAEDTVQINAYNKALKALEDEINEYICSQF